MRLTGLAAGNAAEEELPIFMNDKSVKPVVFQMVLVVLKVYPVVTMRRRRA